MPSFAGQLLIARPSLVDPNFAKSVVLIARHDEDGALGLVLNQPLEVTVKEACETLLEQECAAHGMLLKGGPCEGPLAAVHTVASLADFAIGAGLYFSVERGHLEALLSRSEDEVRFFANYAGWIVGQLEKEILTDSWALMPARAEHIFSIPTDVLWDRVSREASLATWMRIDQIPRDPNLN